MNSIEQSDLHKYHAMSLLKNISYDHAYQQPVHYNLQHLNPQLSASSQPQPQCVPESSGTHSYLKPFSVLEKNSHPQLQEQADNGDLKQIKIKRKNSDQTDDIQDVFREKKKRKKMHLRQVYDEHVTTDDESSPSHFVNLFLDDSIIQLLVDGTNWYINHIPKQRKDKIPPVTPEEIRCVIAVLYLSGYVDLPRVRMFWERAPDTSFPLVVNAIPRDRFETIFTNLHAAGSPSADKKNPLSRISTLLDMMRDKFLQLSPQEECHSVDELRVPYYHQATGLRQFTKTRTMKVWCGCTASGYCVWFDHIQEAHIQSSTTNPNIAANKILTYASQISLPQPNNLTLIYDNIFNTHRMVEELRLMNINAKAVPNRISLAASKSQRVHKTLTDNILKEQSKVHNSPMGGIDKLDQNINLYAITIIGKMWTSHFLLAYLLDLTIQNAWQIYRENNQHSLDLLGFRRSVVTCYLTKYGKPSGANNSKVRHLQCSKSTFEFNEQNSVNCLISRYKDLRYDGLHHYVIPQVKQTRCFHCKMKTMTRCRKCDIGLHVKCFVSYHSRDCEVNKINLRESHIQLKNNDSKIC